MKKRDKEKRDLSEQVVLERAAARVLRDYQKTFELLAAYDRGEWTPPRTPPRR